MNLILYQAAIAITEIDFVPNPFRCQIELGHLDFAIVRPKGDCSEWSFSKERVPSTIFSV